MGRCWRGVCFQWFVIAPWTHRLVSRCPWVRLAQGGLSLGSSLPETAGARAHVLSPLRGYFALAARLRGRVEGAVCFHRRSWHAGWAEEEAG